VIFKPFYRYETGCASYLFGCGTLGKCAVVDPLERFADEYIAFAADKGMQITHVLETHVHADHRSAGRTLAERTGARHGLHRAAEMTFPFEPLEDGQEIELGNTRFVDALSDVPDKPAEMEAIVRFNLGRGVEAGA